MVPTSARSRPVWAAILASVFCLLFTGGCSNPCEELANRLCATPGCEPAQCERWHERTGRVPTETCEAGLRSLDRERIR